jgi:hypothetical protein
LNLDVSDLTTSSPNQLQSFNKYVDVLNQSFNNMFSIISLDNYLPYAKREIALIATAVPYKKAALSSFLLQQFLCFNSGDIRMKPSITLDTVLIPQINACGANKLST